MPTCSTARSITMSAGCARKSSRIRRIRVILRPFGEADTSSRWIRKWRRREPERKFENQKGRRHPDWDDCQKQRAVMRFRFWPNTLAVQLIVVTAAAVALSNISVALWFEYGNERQTATADNGRLLDRAASTALTLSAIPKFTRPVVIDHMSGRLWKFVQVPMPDK